jgi:hypothetical protein
MGQLLFKKCFAEPIRAGTKTTTLRRWASPRVRAGERLFSPGIGWLRIESVEPLASLDSLTDADARADGFENLSQLKRMLRRIYPHAKSDGRGWFKVAFRVDPRPRVDPHPRVDPRPGVDPRIESRIDPSAELLQAVNAALIRRHRAVKSNARRPGASC